MSFHIVIVRKCTSLYSMKNSNQNKTLFVRTLLSAMAVSMMVSAGAPVSVQAAKKRKAATTQTVKAPKAAGVTVPIANLSVTIPADQVSVPETVPSITQCIAAVEQQSASAFAASKAPANTAAAKAKQVPITLGVSGNVLFVLPGMAGCFASIQSAVDASAPGDTIVVFPGTYTESVDAHAKNLNIVGTDRDACILQYTAMNYDTPPLQMAVGCLANMTVLGLADPAVSADRPSYCLHADYDEMIGKPLVVENVTFINQVYSAIGVGLRKSCLVSFKDCSFQAADSSAAFMHDWEMQIPEVNGGNQTISYVNCSFSNASIIRPTIWFNSQELMESCAWVNFEGCNVTNAYGADSAHLINMASYQGRSGNQVHYLGSTDWMLMETSKGNNVPAMNYVEGINLIPAQGLEPVAEAMVGSVTAQ